MGCRNSELVHQLDTNWKSRRRGFTPHHSPIFITVYNMLDIIISDLQMYVYIFFLYHCLNDLHNKTDIFVSWDYLKKFELAAFAVNCLLSV